MKGFWKTTLAVVVGVLIASVLTTVLTIMIVGSLSGSESSVKEIPSSAVLKIDLSKTVISEQKSEMDLFCSVQQDMPKPVGIWDAVCAINAAAKDPAIKFIYLKTDGNTSSIATLQELRRSLAAFRASGKAVVSYIESPSTGSYYLSSVADKVYMTSHPGGMNMVMGVSTQMLFVKDLLDALGVNVQLIRHGKYKSAGEMFTKNAPSAENREQYQVMVSGLWQSLASEIAQSRGISVQELDSYVNGLKLCLPSDFVECKLVDELVTKEELKSKVAVYACEDDFDDVKMVSLYDYVEKRIVPKAYSYKRDNIAVIYANGEIVDGNDVQNVAGDRFASIVSEVRADSTVKAVVLRVNSPGGSVLASEKIRAELDLLKGVKPLVASYGDYAASGGYWISAGCDKIFTDAVTLTGSIGVFGMVPDLSGTMKKVARVNVTAISSNTHGDMYGLMRPFDKAEYDYMLRSIEDIYGRFIGLVSSSRGLETSYVDEIGQGRVWTGADAIDRKLADEIGTLEDAINYAASLAGTADLESWNVVAYPSPLGTMDMLMEMFGEKNTTDNNVFAGASVFKGTPFESVASSMVLWYQRLCNSSFAPGLEGNLVFARMPYGMVVK